MCERVTGKTLDEWAEAMSQRRQRGYRSRDFYGGRIVVIGQDGEQVFNQPEVAQYASRYGLDEDDDLICVRMKTEEIVARRRDYVVPEQDGRFAEYAIVAMVNPEKYPT